MTIAELLDFPGSDGVKTVLLWFLKGSEFPINDWESGGTIRTQTEIETAVIADLIDAIAVQVAGGFVDISEGEWLTVLGHSWYEIDRVPATIAQQTVTIACDAAHGPYAITAANAFVATDGARYFPAAGGTLASGGTLSLDLIGEAPGAARGLATNLVAALAGVTVTAAAIKVVSGTPQYGSDEEQDSAVIARCLARWPSFDAVVGAEDRVARWVKATPTAGITRARLDADQVNPGGVIATVAGASGAVSGGAVTAAQTYVDARAPITDFITVQSASNLTITAGGTVTVPAAQLSQIQIAASAAWTAYLAASQIGSRVYLSVLIKIVMDGGAVDFPDASLNGGVNDVVLGPTEVPVPDASTLADLLTWVTV